MLRFALTIFVSAFLLFQIQPLTARFILPWFGGTPAVWTTCMLFFQLLLLGGYTYAHVSSHYWPKYQAYVHGLLLAVALVFLPIVPSDSWKPTTGSEEPVLRILLLLTASIGLPYFLLSSTGPLVQHWFSQAHPDRSPYRLFALSNAGSLLALLTYPAWFEPLLTLHRQAKFWSIGFIVFAVACLSCTWPGQRKESADAAAPAGDAAGKPSATDFAMWLGLAMFPSVLLLATTNQMCQEVAVVPFLWILPLSLYLISFIICFDKENWYSRGFFGTLLWLAFGLAVVCIYVGVGLPLHFQVFGLSLALFAGCMTCHGELARSKPAPRYLTQFYLAVSAGGALGGLFVVLIATHVFPQYWELHVGVACCAATTLWAYYRSKNCAIAGGARWWAWGGLLALCLALIGGLAYHPFYDEEVVVERNRDFYGVLTVTQGRDGNGDYLSVRHGRIQHGFQYTDEEKRRWKTSYYASGSGVGLAIEYHPKLRSPEFKTLHIGVIGLGAGTLATYGEVGDRVRFYEINPEVERIARKHFTYLTDTQAEVTVVLGDARIKLEQELAAGKPQLFDVLAVDAFSSDAIPMHLLTRECCEVYWNHLDPDDGILAFHISNRYLDLEPVILALAQEFDVEPLLVEFDPEDDDPAESSSTWVLLTRSETFTDELMVDVSATGISSLVQPILWTDDFGSLRQVVRDLDLWQSFLRLINKAP